MVKCIQTLEFIEAGENMEKQEMNSNKKFWNRFASKYDFIIKKDEQAYEEMIKLIRRDVNSKMEMLELATGTGLIALRIADKVKYLEATDFSEEMIKEAISLGVSKINVNTECQLVFAEATRKYIEEGKDLQGKGFDPRKLLAPGFEAIKTCVKEKMELFGSINKA